MRTHWLTAGLAFLLLSIVTTPVGASGVVTLCSRDDEAGAGTNLVTALAGGGTIFFNCPDNARIEITRTHVISQNTTLVGSGVTLDGFDRHTVFEIASPSATLSLDNLRILAGTPTNWGIVPVDRMAAGAIQNLAGGRVFLSDCTFTSNLRAITMSGGFLSIDNCEFLGNMDRIINNDAGTVEIRDSLFSDTAGSSVFGGVLFNSGGTAVVEDSNFSGNRNPGLGAALMNFAGGTMTVRRSRFRENQSGLRGPAIASMSSPLRVEDSEFFRNTASNNSDQGQGGAIAFIGSRQHFEIIRCDFWRNTALLEGGAFYRAGPVEPGSVMVIEQSTFRENSAPNGGAVHLGSNLDNGGAITMRGILFENNQAAERGGAIFGHHTGLELTRSLLVGNVAGITGGAVYLENSIFNPGQVVNTLVVRNTAANVGGFEIGHARIINSTIADNSGGGLRVIVSPLTFDNPENYNVWLSNTILSFNGLVNCDAQVGHVIDEGSNLQFPGASCGGTIRVAPAWLDGYYAPTPLSPARFGANLTVCTNAPVNSIDVFGEHRPHVRRCTIGAVEDSPERRIDPFREG